MSRPIKTFDLFEIVKVPFPYTDVKSTKVRPALILSSARHFNASTGMSVMAMVTSIKQHQVLWPTDVVIENLQVAGLPVPSLVRFKLFTLDHRIILSRLGRLSQEDIQRVQKKLKDIFML